LKWHGLDLCDSELGQATDCYLDGNEHRDSNEPSCALKWV